MKYRIDITSKAPAYLQLYTQVWDDIVMGIYSLNSKLPSKRGGVSVGYLSVNEALKQIDDKKYDAELLERGISNVVKIGIAFRGKTAIVKK